MLCASYTHAQHNHTQECSTDEEVEEFVGQTEQFKAAMQAAAAITAENDIASKALGSMDPLDHASGQ